MRHAAGDLDLALEALSRVRTRRAGPERLERDGLLERDVFALVDFAHAAGAHHASNTETVGDEIAFVQQGAVRA